MRIALLLIVSVLSLPLPAAESGPLDEFRHSLTEDYVDLPADDPTRMEVARLVERLAAQGDPNHLGWQVHLLRNALDAARVLRTLPIHAEDPVVHDLVHVVHTAGEAVDLAGRSLVSQMIDDPDAAMGNISEVFGTSTERWYRLGPIVELLAGRRDREALDLEGLPDDRAAHLAQRIADSEASVRAGGAALRGAITAGDRYAEMDALGALRLAGIDREEVERTVMIEAQLCERAADALPAPDLRERLEVAQHAIAEARRRLVMLEVEQSRLEFAMEGAWEREGRWEETIALLIEAWIDGATTIDPETLPASSPAERALDRQP